jgi:hypothetical protein
MRREVGKIPEDDESPMLLPAAGKPAARLRRHAAGDYFFLNG